MGLWGKKEKIVEKPIIVKKKGKGIFIYTAGYTFYNLFLETPTTNFEVEATNFFNKITRDHVAGLPIQFKNHQNKTIFIPNKDVCSIVLFDYND